jgi:asparagine N-glycosylation enzyme membrane subunit Stt3
MVAADAVAIAVGALLHRRLPKHFLNGAASLLFLGFGLWMLFDAALGWRAVAVAAIVLVALVATAALLRSAPARRAWHTAGPGFRPR